MALVVKDRVKQTTTTTGTGSIVLNGTVDGFQTFAAALANGDTTYYSIFEVSTNAYEIGLGTWNESTSTLARTTVLESSNSGNAINLTAQAEVFITYPAEKSVFLDSNGDVTLGNDLVVTGDFTVNGTTTTVNTTNSVVSDALIELGNGTSGTPSNDAGIVIERGSSDNAFIGYDESADKFTVGTGSFTGASTGNLTISTGTLVANIEGNVTGDVTGNVSGSSGSTTGNAATATALQNARTIAGQSFDGTANIAIAPTDLTGVSADAAEINILDGVTSTTAELNLLDGVTATTTELNYVDGVTSAIQTQLDAKASLSGATFTGDVTVDTNTLHVDSSNNRVGIGTTSPDVLLDVENSSASEIRAIRDGGKSVHLYADASNAILAYKTGDLRIGETSSTVSSNLTERMRIDSSGNVGIGSTTANHFSTAGTANVLGVKSTSGGLISIAATGTNFSGIDLGTDAIRRGGMYSLNGSHLTFYTNSSNSGTTLTERMRISSTGDVGIGTASPSAWQNYRYLDVVGSSSTQGGVIQVYTSGQETRGQWVADNSGVRLLAVTNHSLSFYTNGSERLNIASYGSVGIGTSTPTNYSTYRYLDIMGSATTTGGVIQLKTSDSSVNLNMYSYSGGGVFGTATNHNLAFVTNNTAKMLIDTSGNVGIGASTVDQKLHLEESDTTSVFLKTQNSAGALLVGNNSAGNSFVSSQTSGKPLLFETENTERMRIENDGNTIIQHNNNNYDDGLTLRSTLDWGYGASLSFDAVTSSGGSNGTVGKIMSRWQSQGNHALDFYAFVSNSLVHKARLDADGLDVTGSVTADSLTVDDITINGSTISDAADLTVDVGGAITLDADGGYIDFADGGTTIGRIENSSSDFKFEARVQDKDILFVGNDGGSGITALQLDMSAAGAATFSGNVSLGDDKRMYLGAAGDLQMYHDSANDANIISGTGYNSTTDTFIYTNDNFAVRKGTPSSLENMIFAAGDGSVYLYYNNFIRLTTTSTGVDIGGNLNAVDNIYMAYRLYHEGDTDTYMQFNTNGMQFVCGGGSELLIDTGGVYTLNSALHEDYDSLSGTSPSVDPETGGAWSLTMTGNTTFTFGSTPSNYSTGIIIELTGNGSTVTWPASVDWAGGTAPDAPGNGETDIYVFWTRNGGTTWYGALSIDAAA